MIVNANALHIPLKDKSVQCCVTSPPFWGLRDYGISDQLGLEQTPEEYVENMVSVFREVWRVLRDDGTLWLNLGDSYATTHSVGTTDDKKGWKHGDISQGYQGRTGGAGVGVLKSKDLVGIPWRVAFALQADGWYLRNDIIWHKPNPMPESVRDRCTKSHEYIFLLTKNKKYYYDNDAIREPYKQSSIERSEYPVVKIGMDDAQGMFGKGIRGDSNRGTIIERNSAGANKRSVWTITTKPYKGAHYATFPPELPEICIKAGSAEGDVVLDPFAGSGTTCMVARNLGRQAVGLDLSYDYLYNHARKRLEIDKLDEWGNGSKEVEPNTEGLPMFMEAHDTQHRD